MNSIKPVSQDVTEIKAEFSVDPVPKKTSGDKVEEMSLIASKSIDEVSCKCCSKLYLVRKFFIFFAILFSILISVICIGLLKERVEKGDDLRVEYKRLEDKNSELIKNKKQVCSLSSDTDEKCKDFKDAIASLERTNQQIIRLRAIENRGSPVNFCGSLSSIASGVEGFETACYEHYKCLQGNTKDTEKDCRNIESTYLIIYNNLSDNYQYLHFDRLPSELLYLLLAMSTSLIGGMYRYRAKYGDILEANLSDVLIYYSQGFIAYVITTGAKFVVVLGSQQVVTNVNPYSIALIGCLAGMFFDRFFSLKENTNNSSSDT
jgi:hypothetical protein